MKISDLIEKLEAFKAAHGDLPIALGPTDDEGYLFTTHNLSLDLLRVQLAPAHKPWNKYHAFRAYTEDPAKITHVEFKLA